MKGIIFSFFCLSLLFFGCDEKSVAPELNTDPTVTIISPKNNSDVFDPLNIEILAENIKNIIKVTVFIDNQSYINFTTPPFKATVPLFYFADSTDHILYVKVFTVEDSVYTSDVVYFKYYIFNIEHFEAEHVDGNTLKLKWYDQITAEHGYIIERKIGIGDYEQIAELPGSEKELVMTDMDANSNYQFRVKAFHGDAQSEYEEINVAYVLNDFELSARQTNGSNIAEIVINKDSSYFFTSHYYSSTISKWNPNSQSKVAEYQINNYYVNSICLIENFNLLATCDDYRINLYNLDNFSQVQEINPDHECFKIIYSERSFTLYAAFTNLGIICYSGNNAWSASDTIYLTGIKSTYLSSNNLIVTLNSGNVRIYNLPNRQLIKSYYENSQSVNDIFINEAKNEYYTTSYYNLYVRNLETFDLNEYFETYIFSSSSVKIDYYHDHFIGKSGYSLYAYSRKLAAETCQQNANFNSNNFIIYRATGTLITGSSYNYLDFYKINFRWADYNSYSY